MEVPDDNKSTKSKERRDKDQTGRATPTACSAPQPISNKLTQRNLDDKSAVERLQDFKDPDYLSTKEVELGSSAESDSYPLDQYRKDNACMQFNDHIKKPVEPALDALAELEKDTVKKTPPPRPPRPERMLSQASTSSQTSAESRQTAPTSPSADFVFVTETEVKDAMKSANDAIQKLSPRKRRGLRDGEHHML